MIGGRLWCWLRGHRWSKPMFFHEPLGRGQYRAKVCRRCSLEKEVKRRAKQEKGI